MGLSLCCQIATWSEIVPGRGIVTHQKTVRETLFIRDQRLAIMHDSPRKGFRVVLAFRCSMPGRGDRAAFVPTFVVDGKGVKVPPPEHNPFTWRMMLSRMGGAA